MSSILEDTEKLRAALKLYLRYPDVQPQVQRDFLFIQLKNDWYITFTHDYDKDVLQSKMFTVQVRHPTEHSSVIYHLKDTDINKLQDILNALQVCRE